MFRDEFIEEWNEQVPWDEEVQVLQDLVISRALVEIYSDDFLREELRFRGGTALNKIHFPEPFRYSEDIDVVRMTLGPNGAIIDRLRAVLEPWLGKGQYRPSRVASKLLFDVSNVSPVGGDNVLKLEMSYKDPEFVDPPAEKAFSIEHSWFSGSADIPTFTTEEVLAGKMRALLNRRKGRDLLDLDHALTAVDGLDVQRVVELFSKLCEMHAKRIPRAIAHERMFDKLKNIEAVIVDMRKVLPKKQADKINAEVVHEMFGNVFAAYIEKMPGKPMFEAQSRIDLLGLDIEVRKGK